MLIESINKQINSLNEKLNAYNPRITEETIKELDNFSTRVLANEEELPRFDNTDKLLELVYENSEDLSKNKEEISTLSKIIKSRLECDDESLKSLFELSESQKEFITKMCNDIKDYIGTANKKLEEIKEIEKDIEVYNGILTKMKENEKLNLEDLQVIELNINEEPNENKYNIYKEIVMYNESN